MNLKGKNLRVSWDGRAFARAVSCQINAQVTVSSVSDKDGGEWAENEVTGKSCTITSTLYLMLRKSSWSTLADKSMNVEGHDLHTDGHIISLSSGDTIRMDAYHSTAYLVDAMSKRIIDTHGGGDYTAEEDCAVMVFASDNVQITISVFRDTSNKKIFAEDAFRLLGSDKLLDFSVDRAAWNGGSFEKDYCFMAGKARLTSFEIKGENEGVAQCSVTLTCSGEVRFGEGAAVVSVEFGDGTDAVSAELDE